MSVDYLDLFAGPAGWEQGLRVLGDRGRAVGVELDRDACVTAKLAKHPRIRADVAALPTAMFAGVTGLIASPPCQAWSSAGNRRGELDRAHCHALADRMAAGDDRTDWTTWQDSRSPLVCQPIRYARDLRPEWIALEEVPAVASLWEHFGRIFRSWGYDVWTGDLCAADYGVAQERTRRILIASRVRPVAPPPATHEQYPSDDLFGSSRHPWVSMADALQLDEVRVLVSPANPARTRMRTTHEPAQTITPGKHAAWKWFVAAGVTGEGRPKHVSEPAGTVTSKGTAYWIADPATWRRIRSRDGGAVRVTARELGVLQSFPADYPWFGSSSSRYLQVGNAVPPLLAANVLSVVTGRPMPTVSEARRAGVAA